jgi:hypothetical protein
MERTVSFEPDGLDTSKACHSSEETREAVLQGVEPPGQEREERSVIAPGCFECLLNQISEVPSHLLERFRCSQPRTPLHFVRNFRHFRHFRHDPVCTN